MSAPSKACNIQLVKIQPEERLAISSEQTLTPGRVTYLREAKRERYKATTQVKGLSSEIYHRVGGRYCSFRRRQKSHNRYWQWCENPTESKTVAIYQKDNIGTWENQCIPWMVCNDKPINGKEIQIIHWWSDKSIVAKKFRNGNGAKGFTRRPMEGDTSSVLRDGVKMSTKPKPMTYSTESKEVYLKSWMREICTSSSVRGLIVTPRRRMWL